MIHSRLSFRDDRTVHCFASRWLALSVAAMLAACTTSVPAPVVDRTTRPVSTPPATPMPKPGLAPPTAQVVQPGNTAGSQFHVVQPGETLYAIARNNALDPNALATWNNLAATQPLRVGQVLRLQAPGAAPPVAGGPPPTAAPTTVAVVPQTGVIQGQPLPGGPMAFPPAPVTPQAPSVATPSVTPIEAPLKREPKAQRVAYSDAALVAMQRGDVAPAANAQPVLPAAHGASSPATQPTATPVLPSTPSSPVDADIKPGAGVERDGVLWTWPTTGKVASKFNDKGAMKGIDIAANAGTAMVAASSGKVIYVGKEPRGFGQMIVISHAKETVTVYFNADKVQVKEQQRVLLGQKIAEVSDAAGSKMHFEVRRQGRPLDPLAMMPR
ncbi:MAG: peptidoglycan DD-metalloendopeptidase family protein [Burkholderiales bacterium]|nr:peptidoglycan DD-metalloendopeptidase family protein [Burkholderiales bacterium]